MSLVDEVFVTIKAGHGGPGRVSFYPAFKAGPDGGDGGKGGDVYIRGTKDTLILKIFLAKKLIEAENGEPGGKNKKNGKKGMDLIIEIPIGCTLKDTKTGQIIEIKSQDMILIAKGGKGGLGNWALRSSRRTTPEFAQPGLAGEEKNFHISLQLIADVGLIGLPNAGKTSLLNFLTRSSGKVGNYAFTTLEPNLGVYNGVILADIPGLIEGASEGKGLGYKFLKHIEKTKVLFHLISANSEDSKRDYEIVRNELKKFNSNLLSKKEYIILTKSDLVEPNSVAEKIKKLEKLNKNIAVVSIYDSSIFSILAPKLVSFSTTSS